VLAALALRWASGKFLSVLASLEHTRYSREFLTRPSVRDRFRQYYRYSLAETDRLLGQHGIEIPRPTHVVFGHTHQPIPWQAEELVDVVDGHPVTFCNTGGWLLRENQSALDFVSAEVLLYETGRVCAPFHPDRRRLSPEAATLERLEVRNGLRRKETDSHSYRSASTGAVRDAFDAGAKEARRTTAESRIATPA
jgi:hypothetical protein